MKKFINKNILFGFIIGLLVMGIAGVSAATLYYSNQVSYTPSDTSWNVDNVEKALNALHEIKVELETLKGLGDATADDIAIGKTAVIKGKLVTGKIKTNNNIEFETIENPSGTNIAQYTSQKIKNKNLTFSFGERLSYNDSNYADYMCYIYPVDFTNVSTITLYQWNYISMYYTLALSFTNQPIYSRQEIINNALTTWTYSTAGTTSAANYITRNVDVSSVTGSKYMCMAVVSKNNSATAYYSLSNSVVSFN